MMADLAICCQTPSHDGHVQFQYSFRLALLRAASDPAQDSGATRMESARAMKIKGRASTVAESTALW